MICDQLAHLAQYRSRFTSRQQIDFDKILQFLARPDLSTLTPGRLEIDDSKIYANLDEYTTKAAANKQFEIHQYHADLQILLAGSECMEFATNMDLQQCLSADAAAGTSTGGDVQFFQVCPDYISRVMVRPGEFVHFPVGIPHRPGLDLTAKHGISVRKLVIKIRME